LARGGGTLCRRGDRDDATGGRRCCRTGQGRDRDRRDNNNGAGRTTSLGQQRDRDFRSSATVAAATAALRWVARSR